MNEQYYEADKQLKKLYINWLDELANKYPEFLGYTYSNPYYLCVPKGWFESSKRILIVGEEGFGMWGRGKSDGIKPENIQKIQTFCWSSLASYLNKDELNYQLYPNAELYSLIKSPFWKRARGLYKYGACAWTNIDKIHILGNKRCCLSEGDRIKLHSLRTKVLKEEIKILAPTHIVFFGWYGISLKDELPEVFSELYPQGLGDNSLWKKNVVSIKYGDMKFIFAYHPNWGFRQKGYEAKVIEKFNNPVCDIDLNGKI